MATQKQIDFIATLIDSTEAAAARHFEDWQLVKDFSAVFGVTLNDDRFDSMVRAAHAAMVAELRAFDYTALDNRQTSALIDVLKPAANVFGTWARITGITRNRLVDLTPELGEKIASTLNRVFGATVVSVGATKSGKPILRAAVPEEVSA